MSKERAENLVKEIKSLLLIAFGSTIGTAAVTFKTSSGMIIKTIAIAFLGFLLFTTYKKATALKNLIN